MNDGNVSPFMQQTKYAELKGLMGALQGKIEAQDRMIRAQQSLLRDISFRFSALGDLCERADVFTSKDFEDATDLYRGLRMKGGDEIVTNGDIVWVSYHAIHNGKPFSEENFPVRVGSGATVFEVALLAQKVTAKGIAFEKELDGVLAKFSIDIMKVKTKIEPDLKEAEPAVASAPAENGESNGTS